MTTTPAGWYPDPEREGATRWWDGAQWAPSQDADAPSEDRFKPRDDAAATSTGAPAADATWSPTPYEGPGTAWEQQDQPAAQWSQHQDGAGWDRSPGQATDAAAAPAWGQQDAPATEQPSWSQQSSTPAWGQQDAQAGYAAPQDYGQTGTQQWNQYDAKPKKSRTGLIIGIAAGALVLVLLLVVGGGFLVTSLLGTATQQTQTQGGGGGGGTQTPGSSFEVTVAADGQTYTDIEITTAGTYEIAVDSVNGEDPRIELTGNGLSSSDDDGGDGLNSLLTEDLAVGTYSLMVEEFSGDPLVAQVTVTQR